MASFYFVRSAGSKKVEDIPAVGIDGSLDDVLREFRISHIAGDRDSLAALGLDVSRHFVRLCCSIPELMGDSLPVCVCVLEASDHSVPASKSVTTTLAPSAANKCAVASPIPWPDPVTMATCNTRR